MTAKVISGKEFSENVRSEVLKHVTHLKNEHAIVPGLAVVLIGDDPASQVYVRNKGEQTKAAGMKSLEFKLEENTSEKELLELIEKLNQDRSIHGILCQLPLPAHINEELVINSIAPDKDVDGFHISNVGLLGTGQKSMVPCTPLGCLMMLKDHHGDLTGLNAVVIGRSNIVGKPMANLLLKESCTVTIVHSKTKDIREICKKADILIAAVGRAEMIDENWISEGATVIDVGINRIPNPEKPGKSKLVGDVDYQSAIKVAGAITPVPGGVGPMTIACLLANTVTACCRANNLPEPERLSV